MKKTILFAGLLAFVGMMTSCLRDDDLEMLKHPIHAVGSVDPTWGVPVATGELNMNDLLSHLAADYQGLINPDSNVITVMYNMSAKDTIWAFSAVNIPTPPFPSSHRGKKGFTKSGSIYTKDSVIVDTIDIDLFNHTSGIDHIQITHAWLDLAVAAYSNYCTDMVRRNTTVVFDSLEIWYDDKNGNHIQFAPSAFLDFSVVVNDLTEGFHHSFPTIDVAGLVNGLPSRIYTKYHFKLNVSDSIITQNIFAMPFAQILDSMRMTNFIYSADLDVQIPLSMQVDNMKDTFDVDMGEGLANLNLDSIMKTLDEGITVEITDSKFTLTLENGIPLDFTLTARMYDENGTLKWTAFTDKAVASANLASNADGSYRATTPKKTVLTTELNANDIKKLSESKVMKVFLNIDSGSKHVVVDKDDYLKVQAYLMIHPTTGIDIEISSNGLMK